MRSMRYSPQYQPGLSYHLFYGDEGEMDFDNPAAVVVEHDRVPQPMDPLDALNAFKEFRELDKQVSLELIPSLCSLLPEEEVVTSINEKGEVEKALKQDHGIRIEGKTIVADFSKLSPEHAETAQTALDAITTKEVAIGKDAVISEEG